MNYTYENNLVAIKHDLPLLKNSWKDFIATMLDKLSPWTSAGKPVYLFGAGMLGVEIGRTFAADLPFAGYIDNNASLTGMKINGLRVFNLAEVVRDTPGALAIITTRVEPYVKEITEQCRALPIDMAEWMYFFNDTGNDPKRVLALRDIDEEPFLRALELLSDAQSKDICIDLLYRRLSVEHYFCTDLIPLKYYRSFVDVGAYTGDTFEDFKRKIGDDFDHYYMIEVIKSNASALQKMYGGDKRVRVFQIAASDGFHQFTIGDASGLERFGGKADATRNGELVTADTLDHALAGCPVTMLKFDIEGDELAALRGAAGLIAEQRPALIICVYHKVRDLWEIPQWIHDLNLGYRIFFRHHVHPVCIAIPC